MLKENTIGQDAVFYNYSDHERFLHGTYTNDAGSRDYKLYVPEEFAAQPLPLLVMLHGCNQGSDDFANATNMNRIADTQPCFVVYPEQSSHAHRYNCWNWYAPSNQRRDQGEPSIIAGITRSIIASYPIDTKRVYIAGLSAGGAMAAIMGITYPDLYAAVGIHSGLPYGAAHDLLSAYDAMLYGARHNRPAHADGKTLPTIVFHGDRDTTVHPANAERILAQAAHEIDAARLSDTQDHTTVVLPQPADFGQYGYTRTIRFDEERRIYVEHWLVHGAGHAWSGGHLSGSFVDPKGPDASQEMMRFFLNVHEYCTCC